MKHRIGALTISQSPRRDLLAPLHVAFPDCDIIESGALDFTDINNLPDGTDSYYPLATTLNNGDVVTLGRDFLSPLVQDALDGLESQGVDVTILLCAGDFPDLNSHHPLINPTRTAQHILSAMGMKYIAVISPIKIQNTPIMDKWKNAGFQSVVWTMPPDTTSIQQADWINGQLRISPDTTCVVLDYVGYPTDATLTLQQHVKKPIFDLGHLAISAISGWL